VRLVFKGYGLSRAPYNGPRPTCGQRQDGVHLGLENPLLAAGSLALFGARSVSLKFYARRRPFDLPLGVDLLGWCPIYLAAVPPALFGSDKIDSKTDTYFETHRYARTRSYLVNL
jgi:hypothetical protein